MHGPAPGNARTRHRGNGGTTAALEAAECDRQVILPQRAPRCAGAPRAYTASGRSPTSRLRLRQGGALQLAYTELQLGADPAQLTTCPAIYWGERGAHFVACKTAPGRYHCQLFLSDAEQYGTEAESYDDLERRVVTPLQVQSDHERQIAEVSASATAADLKADDDYHGPLMV
jgi:hypothetical protein